MIDFTKLSNLEFVATITVVSAATSLILYFLFHAKEKWNQTQSEIAPVEIENSPASSILIWQTIYQQSAETLRDQAKILVSLNTAGLAATIAILGGSNSFLVKKVWLSASLLLFSIGLFFSLLPIVSLAEKFKKDLSFTMAAIRNQNNSTIKIRHAFSVKSGVYLIMVVLFILFGGVFSLGKALS